MDYRRLGRSDITVSTLCLGTMTWGEQNSPEDAFAQIDRALAAGVNFLDTAEMYSIKTRAETYGRSEEIIGEWIARSGRRNEIVVATKIVGPSAGGFRYIRGGKTRFTRAYITAALGSTLFVLQGLVNHTRPWASTARSFGVLIRCPSSL